MNILSESNSMNTVSKIILVTMIAASTNLKSSNAHSYESSSTVTLQGGFLFACCFLASLPVECAIEGVECTKEAMHRTKEDMRCVSECCCECPSNLKKGAEYMFSQLKTKTPLSQKMD